MILTILTGVERRLLFSTIPIYTSDVQHQENTTILECPQHKGGSNRLMRHLQRYPCRRCRTCCNRTCAQFSHVHWWLICRNAWQSALVNKDGNILRRTLSSFVHTCNSAIRLTVSIIVTASNIVHTIDARGCEPTCVSN
jgi:hypothetical protein